MKKQLTKFLTFVREGPRYVSPGGQVQRQWFVRCECGVEKLVRRSAITSGLTISCGSCGRLRSPMLTQAYIKNNVKRDENGCWNWQLSTYGSDGYGQASFKGPNGKAMELGAHRAAWLVFRGEYGDKWVLHTCENKRCCNPKHLYLGTASDNMKDTYRGKHGERLKKFQKYRATQGDSKKHLEEGRKLGWRNGIEAANAANKIRFAKKRKAA